MLSPAQLASMRRDNGRIFSQNSMYRDLRELFGGEFQFHYLRHPYVKPTTKNFSTFLKFLCRGLFLHICLIAI